MENLMQLNPVLSAVIFFALFFAIVALITWQYNPIVERVPVQSELEQEQEFCLLYAHTVTHNGKAIIKAKLYDKMKTELHNLYFVDYIGNGYFELTLKGN